MAIVRFGNTWWGRKWLGALNAIDFSNRLPRGERYARNGSVRSIEIGGTSITARVKGRQPAPYRVSMRLGPLGKAEKRIVDQIVSSDLYYLAQLEASILPPELHDDLKARKIELFPSSWKDLGMHCSCPDWAVPCKHLAAVVYLIANEIDKNPFLVFTLRGHDLLEAFRAAGKKEEPEPIPTLDSMVAHEPEPARYFEEKLAGIDFTVIPELADATVRLLTERPLFYLKGDFKEILDAVYRKVAREAERFIRSADLREEAPEALFTHGEIRLRKGTLEFAGRLKGGRQELVFSSEVQEFARLVDVVGALTVGDLSAYPPLPAFLAMIHSYALMLLRRGAFIPDIVALKEKTYGVRWIPSLFNAETAGVFEALVGAAPSNIVRYGTKTLEKREQVLFLVSFFLLHYLRLFSPAGEPAGDEILSLFFGGVPFRAVRFEHGEIARTIHLWLGRFFIRPAECTPAIFVDEAGEETFRFSVRVRDARSADPLPMEMKAFLESDHPEKFALLKDLSLLSTYLPTVNRFLRARSPVEVPAGEFLPAWFAALPVFRTLNVRTVVPKVLAELFRPELTLAFSAKTGQRSDGVRTWLDLRQLLEFSWTVSAGGEFIDAEEFRRLAARYRGFVRYRDRYLFLDDQELARISRMLESPPELNPMELLRFQLEGEYNGVPVQAGEALRALLGRFFTPREVPIPRGLTAVLRPYQEKGYRWLYHNYAAGFGSLIADDMGLGKTVQVIAFFEKLREDGVLKAGDGGRALVIVPAGLLTNWKRELARFAPDLAVSVFHGGARTLDPAAEVIVTTYGQVREKRKLFLGAGWLCVVTDEAQNIKNPDTAQARAVKAVPGAVKIAMTGTPVENRLMDYWSVLDFTMKDLVGSRKTFKEHFAVPIEKFKDRAGLERFRRLTAPFILRRIKTDRTIISDLPDKIKVDRYADLTTEQAALYAGLVDSVDELLSDSEGIQRRGLVFKLITGLKQICDHPALYTKSAGGGLDRSGKGALLLDLLEKIIARREKVLVFTQFREMGHLLESPIGEAFGGAPLFLHGGLSRKERDACVDAFQGDPSRRIMLLSLKAGGTGLNLTAAVNVIHYDLWWNPAVEEQATDRAFRIGQTRNVTVHRLITGGTFEEKINEMLTGKRELADLAVNVGEGWIADLSNRDLKELLRLER